MKPAFSQARNCKRLKKIVFIDYGDKIFSHAWAKLQEEKPESNKKSKRD